MCRLARQFAFKTAFSAGLGVVTLELDLGTATAPIIS